MDISKDDASLVQAARRGERDAFAALLDRHRRVLVALCRHALGDVSLAEDAAQEAALQAMLNLDRLRDPDRFGAWLAGIGLNVCRRWLRHRSREVWSWEALLGGSRIAEPTDRAPIPEEAAETAAHLGIEVGAVKTRLHKARGALRRRLWTLWMEENVTAQAGTQPVEVRIRDIRRIPSGEGKPQQHVVVLEENGGGRQLPIWIGPAEAEALALQTEKVQPPRPATYAFTASLLQAAESRLREVRITRLTGNVFYAVAEVEGPRGSAVVDARPSDALNLAAAAGAPIRVEPAVFEANDSSHAAPTFPVRDPFGAGTVGVQDIAAEVTARWAAQDAPASPKGD
ncbi:MAG TPA: bifunctional nuclease domain-containing protein [Chloroflexota bacterium]|nr:bifunctional nuclease domain-containing protein [Chloroflexota bacterium]